MNTPFSLLAFRLAGVRLVLALILGLLLVPGFVVAPILFAKAGSSHLAGTLAGEIFHVTGYALLMLLAALATFWLRLTVGWKAWAMLGALALLVMVNLFVISPEIAALKAQMGPIDLVAKDNPLRAEFGLWHGISATFHAIATLIATLLVLLSPGSKQ